MPQGASDRAPQLALALATRRVTVCGSTLRSSALQKKQVQDSGLFTERGKERFAGMAVIPELSGGLVRWLAGRALRTGVKPRFQSLPGPKPVLGLGSLGTAPPFVVVAEGLFDWLTLARWGIPVVAALGTHGLERVASALRGCPRVFVAFDNDNAGREAAERLESLLGGRAAVVALPDGIDDVAELATHPMGRKIFLRSLARAARHRR